MDGDDWLFGPWLLRYHSRAVNTSSHERSAEVRRKRTLESVALHDDDEGPLSSCVAGAMACMVLRMLSCVYSAAFCLFQAFSGTSLRTASKCKLA